MNPVVVFDFDKTLTYRDTIMDFYRYCNPDGLIPVKTLRLMFWAVLYKFRLISNDKLKQKGTRIFLSGIDEQELKKKGEAFSKRIVMNDIYENYFIRKYPEAIIASASYSIYLRHLFQPENIIGTELAWDNKNRACGVLFNAYGSHKVEKLRERGINKINILFTDSFSDRPLMELADQVYLVKNGKQLIPLKPEN